jgi:hypothetical protein
MDTLVAWLTAPAPVWLVLVLLIGVFLVGRSLERLEKHAGLREDDKDDEDADATWWDDEDVTRPSPRHPDYARLMAERAKKANPAPPEDGR